MHAAHPSRENSTNTSLRRRGELTSASRERVPAELTNSGHERQVELTCADRERRAELMRADGSSPTATARDGWSSLAPVELAHQRRPQEAELTSAALTVPADLTNGGRERRVELTSAYCERQAPTELICAAVPDGVHQRTQEEDDLLLLFFI